MIRKPTESEHYQLKQHLGKTALGYFLEMIEAMNQHMADCDKHNNHPSYGEEETDAGRQAEGVRTDSGLPGSEPGK